MRKMAVIAITILVGKLGTLAKVFKKRLEDLKIRGRIKAIQTTALLNQTKISRRVLEKRLGELETRGRN